MTQTIRLPYPPSVNHYWRMFTIAGRPRMLISSEGRRYRETVKAELLGRYGVLRPLAGQVAVSIAATMPDRRQRDIDNILKAALDALTEAGVWGDDSQIVDLRIARAGVENPGWIDVTIAAA